MATGPNMPIIRKPGCIWLGIPNWDFDASIMSRSCWLFSPGGAILVNPDEESPRMASTVGGGMSWLEHRHRTARQRKRGQMSEQKTLAWVRASEKRSGWDPGISVSNLRKGPVLASNSDQRAERSQNYWLWPAICKGLSGGVFSQVSSIIRICYWLCLANSSCAVTLQTPSVIRSKVSPFARYKIPLLSSALLCALAGVNVKGPACCVVPTLHTSTHHDSTLSTRWRQTGAAQLTAPV